MKSKDIFTSTRRPRLFLLTLFLVIVGCAASNVPPQFPVHPDTITDNPAFEVLPEDRARLEYQVPLNPESAELYLSGELPKYGYEIGRTFTRRDSVTLEISHPEEGWTGSIVIIGGSTDQGRMATTVSVLMSDGENPPTPP